MSRAVSPNPHGGVFSLTTTGNETVHDAPSESKEEDAAPESDSIGLDEHFIAEIMMSLDADKLEALRRAFEAHDDDGLSLTEFVHVMTSIVGSTTQSKGQFAANLMEFFSQVDINGDGSMEWEEFTSFIVEMGMSSHDNQPDAISKYFFSGREPCGNDNVPVGFIRGFCNDTIAIVDQNSPIISIYSSSFDLISTINCKLGVVHCVDYIPHPENIYAVSSMDMSISFYAADTFAFLKLFRTPAQNTTAMRWIQSRGLLYTGDTKGFIRAWDVKNMVELHVLGVPDFHSFQSVTSTSQVSNGSFRSTGLHRDIVLDIIDLDGLEILATASIDKTIKLWDAVTNKLRRTLNGHSKGVRQIAYSPEYRFLFSVGFDFDVLVWNPYVANLILKLSDHGCSLCGVSVVPTTPILVTADSEGFFRVWDIRNFTCVQTFKTEEKNVSSNLMTGFIAVTSTKRVVGTGRELHFFDYEKIEMPELTDEFPLVMALYNPITYTFITVSNRYVKIWDGYHGKVMRVYRNLSATDITSCCLDFRLRKFILGDHEGKLSCFDFMNGAEMKSFEYEETDDKAHLDEITKAVYCNEDATMITVSWDRSIAIHDEAEAEEGVLLRRIENSHNSDISALAFSHNLSLIATGSADNVLKIWDYEFCRQDTTLYGHISAITCVAFLDPFPLLVSCDVGGNVLLWAVKPSRFKNKILSRWKHRPAIKGSSKPTAAAITCLSVSWKYTEKEEEKEDIKEGRSRRGSHIRREEGREEEKQQFSEENQGFAEKSLESSEDAQRWLERLKKLTKNRKSSRGKSNEKAKVAEYKLYAGDERGNVVIWDLLPTLESLMKEYGETQFGTGVVENPVECGNPRRHIKYDASNGASMSDGTRVGGKTGKSGDNGDNSMAVSSDAVVILGMWHAHSDAINSIQLISDPLSLLTGSHDKLAKIWQLDGKSLGVLRQGGNKANTWKFTYDQQGIANTKLEAGTELMEEVEGMGELELASDDSEEEKEEDDGDGTFTVDLDGIGFQEAAGSIRKTPKRIPVNASNVGRRRHK
jgi:WD40 repeat protein